MRYELFSVTKNRTIIDKFKNVKTCYEGKKLSIQNIVFIRTDHDDIYKSTQHVKKIS